MAVLPTFDGIKTAGIENARPYGICENFHNYMRAQDFQVLIDAAIPDMVYLYRSGIVTDEMLSLVDEALLNANGIYTSNAIVTNPGLEIFVLGTAEVIITVDDGSRQNINVMGSGIGHVTISGNTWLKLQTWKNATATLIVNDTSTACVDAAQSSEITATFNDNSNGDVSGRGDTSLTLTANDTSYVLFQGFGHSLVTTTGTIEQKFYDLSRNTATVLV